jgi:hypothetical protein
MEVSEDKIDFDTAKTLILEYKKIVRGISL